MGHQLPPARKWKGFENFSDEELKSLVQTGIKAQQELDYRQQLKKWEQEQASIQWARFLFLGACIIAALVYLTICG